MRRTLLALLAIATAVVTLAACDPATTASFYHEPIEAVTPQQQFDLFVFATRIATRDNPTLVCIRSHESASVQPTPWHAYNPDGPYYGAYQYVQGTWNSAAAYAGRPDLVGKPPIEPYVAWYDQDAVTLAYHQAVGDDPWGGFCR